MLVRFLILIAVLMLLSACGVTRKGDEIRDKVRDTVASVADQGLENAESLLCFASTVGSVRRRYGSNPERWESYWRFCQDRVPSN